LKKICSQLKGMGEKKSLNILCVEGKIERTGAIKKGIGKGTAHYLY